ncbi:hypothetical protein [Hymenobacter negativus]|nr:hypothetical protein [Hymenobacter negativus]
MNPNGSFLHIDNFSDLGKVYVHDHNPEVKRTIVRPVFKVEKVENQAYYFAPGFIDTDNIFFSCPLAISYVQVNSAKQILPQHGHSSIIELDIKAFNKTLSSYVNAKIEIKRWNIDFKIIGKVINFINQYINSERDIKLIDFNCFSKIDLNFKDKSIIISAIDNLEFVFFDNSINRVGKDNFFWIEAEIRNMPEDRYLRKLIISNLANQCTRVETKEYGALIVFDIESAYTASYSRRMIEESTALEKKAKDLLKLDMAIEYNPVEQSIEQLAIK